jgi:hypothetical protein
MEIAVSSTIPGGLSFADREKARSIGDTIR